MDSGQQHSSIVVDGLEDAGNNKSIKKQCIKLPKTYTTADQLMPKK